MRATTNLRQGTLLSLSEKSCLQGPLPVINVSVLRPGAMSFPSQTLYSTRQNAWHSKPVLNSTEWKVSS
ncbi:Hypothetical predicted protein [Lynx pardinus]|uniref:Uncharacterized protein n=1 Tax=Lynx pardinus TaxID=191816 RepID=A0A485N078_LYNPA|nr:Hypothetical predicted protein [Lynx pardinus]